MPDFAQPNASQMPEELLEAVLACVESSGEAVPADIVHRDQHSNDFAEVRLKNGRALIVKRARYDWAAPRFRASRVASRMIREETSVAVPAPLPVPTELDDRPLEAYWRIDLPTLEEVWPRLDGEPKRQALRSWGELAAQLHSVKVAGFGPVGDPVTPGRSLDEYLHSELEHRLLPAITAEWPAAASVVHRLIRSIGQVVERIGDDSRLVHNDLHAGNVLCELDGGEIRCVGLIDLETAVGAPREADLAIMEVQHGGLFGPAFDGSWLEEVHGAYSAGAVDPWVVNFYRVFHMVNMGFYSAIIGHEHHAAEVAGAAAREVGELDRSRRSGTQKVSAILR